MKKKHIIISSLIAILIFGIATYFILNEEEETSKVKEVTVTEEIEKFGYKMDSDATNYYKDLFKKLKEELESDEIDYDKYAKLLSQLFVADLFNIDNKVSSRDIGGTQFVYEDFQSDFAKIEQSQLYNNVENNVYGDREQELPVVSQVNVDKLEQTKFTYNKQEYDGYIVTLSIDYEKDLSYPTEVTVTLIKTDKLLSVAKLQ